MMILLAPVIIYRLRCIKNLNYVTEEDEENFSSLEEYLYICFLVADLMKHFIFYYAYA